MGRLFNENKGSTLLMIMITMAVLSVLAIALISMTMMNVNMKYNDYRGKRSVYFAEAGIDEAYALVGGLVDDALLTATTETETQISDLIATAPTTSAIYNLDGTLNDDVLQTTSDAIFVEAFKDAFNSHSATVISTSITAIATQIDPTISSGEYVINIDLDSTKIVKYDADASNPDQYIISGLTATYTYLDFTEKTVSTDIVINAPDFQYAIKAVENIVSLDINPLWQHALVANSGNITFEGGVSTINGDIYALGEKPASVENYKDASQFGGIIVEGGSTTIIGDVVSDSYVQTDGNSSKLYIEDAHVYCDSLTIQSTANNSGIYVSNSNVYTSDDIELNGPNSTIYIDGSYHGYNDGSGHYNSSCILVNSDLYDGSTGSKIKITGSNPSIAYDDGEGANYHGVFIAGTSYVNAYGSDYYGDTETWPYQTGESLSIRKNYYAYSYNLNVSNPGFAIPDYNNVDFASPTGSTFQFAIGYDDGIGAPTRLNQNQKAEYFMTFYNEAYLKGYATDYLNLGTSDSIDIDVDTYKYILGSAIGTSSSGMNVVVNDDNNYFTDPEYDSYFQKQISIDNDYYLLRGSNNSEFENEITSLMASEDPDILDYYTATSTGVGITNYQSDGTYVLNGAEGAREVVYVSDVVTESDIYTIGTSSSDDLNLGDTDNNGQGVIIYNGDIEIDNSINFVGVIIAKGSITITDSGTKRFYNFDHDHTSYSDQEKYIIRLIRDTPGLEAYFDNNLPNSDNVNDNAWFVEDVIVESSEESNKSQNRYNELIHYDNWHID